MRNGIQPIFPLVILGFLILHLDVASLQADVVRPQTLALQRGWNAVFLEVYPSESEPAALFANTPIDVAASFYAPISSAQFMTDPGVDLFKAAGWGVWYAESRPEAFLKTLHAINGQQAYLIHASSDYTWKVEGTVVSAKVRWQPDSYNLVGFGVHPQAAPTFAQFFAGSAAHRQDRIYRLSDGSWRRVTSPDAETMRSGEAFWIYCQGNSRFQGPLQVETKTRHGLLLGQGVNALVLRNTTDHPIAPTVEHVPSGPDSVPLSIVMRAVGDQSSPIRSIAVPRPEEAWSQPLPPLEAGRAIQVPFEVRLQDMTSRLQDSLLRISTDLGTELWIPVVSLRQDLKDN